MSDLNNLTPEEKIKMVDTHTSIVYFYLNFLKEEIENKNAIPFRPYTQAQLDEKAEDREAFYKKMIPETVESLEILRQLEPENINRINVFANICFNATEHPDKSMFLTENLMNNKEFILMNIKNYTLYPYMSEDDRSKYSVINEMATQLNNKINEAASEGKNTDNLMQAKENFVSAIPEDLKKSNVLMLTLAEKNNLLDVLPDSFFKNLNNALRTLEFAFKNKNADAVEFIFSKIEPEHSRMLQEHYFEHYEFFPNDIKVLPHNVSRALNSTAQNAINIPSEAEVDINGKIQILEKIERHIIPKLEEFLKDNVNISDKKAREINDELTKIANSPAYSSKPAFGANFNKTYNNIDNEKKLGLLKFSTSYIKEVLKGDQIAMEAKEKLEEHSGKKIDSFPWNNPPSEITTDPSSNLLYLKHLKASKVREVELDYPQAPPQYIQKQIDEILKIPGLNKIVDDVNRETVLEIKFFILSQKIDEEIEYLEKFHNPKEVSKMLNDAIKTHDKTLIAEIFDKTPPDISKEISQSFIRYYDMYPDHIKKQPEIINQALEFPTPLFMNIPSDATLNEKQEFKILSKISSLVLPMIEEPLADYSKKTVGMNAADDDFPAELTSQVASIHSMLNGLLYNPALQKYSEDENLTASERFEALQGFIAERKNELKPEQKSSNQFKMK